jgi:hypothetical protein
MSNSYTLQGYITFTPIYQRDDTPTTTTRTTTIAFEEPIGRKELATIWWKNCPNHCKAHLSCSKNPCLRYCKQLRKNVSILSKQMLTLEHVSVQNVDGVDCNNNISISNHERRKFTMHPHAIYKNQSKLIHIVRIVGSFDNQISCERYDIRIGKDRDHPWMRFHVTVHQHEQPSTIRTPTIASTTTKRKLVFDFNNSDRSSPPKAKRDKRKSSTDDLANSRLSNHDDEICYSPRHQSEDLSNVVKALQCRTTAKTSYWMEKSSDIPSYHSDESGNVTDVDPISTQQIIGEQSYPIPAVTPGTVTTSNRSSSITKRIFDEEKLSTPIRFLSQRQLFHNEDNFLPDNVTGTTTTTTKTHNSCFSIQKSSFTHNNENVSQTDSTNNKAYFQSQSYFCDKHDNVCNDYEMDDENEQFSTYLSLPIPESDNGSLVDNSEALVIAPTMYSLTKNDEYVGIAPTTYHNGTTSKVQVDSTLNHQQNKTLTGRKLFDLKLKDWQNLKNIEEKKFINDRKKPISQFHKAMIELILLKNQQDSTTHTSTSSISSSLGKETNYQSSVWLPSIINHETTLSSLWNVEEGSQDNNDIMKGVS